MPPLASGFILIVVRDANNIRHILRSTDSTGTDFASTPLLDFPANGRLHSDRSWVEYNGAVYVAEYGDPSPAVVVWKSVDDARAYGSQTTSTSAGSGKTDVSVSDWSKPLNTGTLYHVRLVAANSGGTTYGQDVQFRTP